MYLFLSDPPIISGAGASAIGVLAASVKQPTMAAFLAKSQPYSQTSARQLAINRAIGEYIVTDLKPLSTIEGKGFRKMLNILDERYTPVSRATMLEKTIVPMYQETKIRVLNNMSKALRHAFTSDGWTSGATEGFLTYTIHYIDPETFKQHSHVLDTHATKESHTAENLAKDMKAVVAKWSIKNPVGVTDNAANVVKATYLNHYPHLGCFAHTLNLAVKKALKVTEVSALQGKLRKVVGAFKHSELRTLQLHNAEAAHQLKTLNLLQDVDTRWNSFLDMIRRLLKIMPAIVSVLYQCNLVHLVPSDIDISRMEELVAVLLPFEIATKMVCVESQPTCSMILPIMSSLVQRDLHENTTDSPMLRKAKSVILKDLESRYTDTDKQRLLKISSFLDPRFKELNWLSQDEHGEVKQWIVDDLREGLPVHVKQEKELDHLAVGTPAVTPAVTPALPALPDLSDDEVALPLPMPVDPLSESHELPVVPLRMDNFFDVIYVRTEKSTVSNEEKIRREITRYTEEDVLSIGGKPLEWWGERKGTYPLLSNLVQKYLCIPATSVPSERVFSTAGNIVTKKRCALDASNVDMLIFLHGNY
jgi:hypothetical protein